jgi:hypothetical protein
MPHGIVLTPEGYFLPIQHLLFWFGFSIRFTFSPSIRFFIRRSNYPFRFGVLTMTDFLLRYVNRLFRFDHSNHNRIFLLVTLPITMAILSLRCSPLLSFLSSPLTLTNHGLLFL